jgi:hypothetical protein
MIIRPYDMLIHTFHIRSTRQNVFWALWPKNRSDLPEAKLTGDRKTEKSKSVLQCKAESYGNNQDYLLRRLKRDAPDVADDLAINRGPVIVLPGPVATLKPDGSIPMQILSTADECMASARPYFDGMADTNPTTQGQVQTSGNGPGKVGRNAPCPCGSGLKFKKCCGN